MSKLEKPMIRWYWEQVGGTLCEEFHAVPRSTRHARRLIDAVILPDGQRTAVHWRDLDLNGRDVVVVQAKANRLGMYLMGQALFSARLLEQRFSPKSVRSVALCRTDDVILRSLFEAIPGMEVVVVPAGSAV